MAGIVRHRCFLLPPAMTCFQTPPQRPAAFARPVLLIIGCGDVGLRVLAELARRGVGAASAAGAQRGWRVLALTSSPERASVLRAAGALPLIGNLDDPATLRRLAGLADAVLHLAPPPGQGASDPRTQRLALALRRSGHPPARWVYASTSGVYGDCEGAFFNETRPVRPATDRARRRVHAENCWREAGRAAGVNASILRIPGIYALNRDGGDPRARLLRATPVLAPADDVFTNHIHADDLARACLAALQRAKPQRIYHVCDDSQRLMGAHFDAVADASGLPRPPRLSRAEAAAQLSAMQMSFLSESRRLSNQRLKRELRLALRYPDVLEALKP
jgi:nucleoside-diphosphate-sugar epimerase